MNLPSSIREIKIIDRKIRAVRVEAIRKERPKSTRGFKSIDQGGVAARYSQTDHRRSEGEKDGPFRLGIF